FSIARRPMRIMASSSAIKMRISHVWLLRVHRLLRNNHRGGGAAPIVGAQRELAAQIFRHERLHDLQAEAAIDLEVVRQAGPVVADGEHDARDFVVQAGAYTATGRAGEAMLQRVLD